MNDKIAKAFDSLEISANSTLDEAKQAWRDLAQVWHPDKHQSNERLQLKATEKLKEINGAWDVIKEYFASPNHEDYTQDSYTRDYYSSERTKTGRKTSSAKYKSITCPHCGTANQLLQTALIELAKCDACGKYLSMAEEVKEQARRAEINKQREHQAELRRRKERNEREQLRKEEQRRKEEQLRRDEQQRKDETSEFNNESLENGENPHITVEATQPLHRTGDNKWFKWRYQYNWIIALWLVIKIVTHFVGNKPAEATPELSGKQKIEEQARYDRFKPTKTDQVAIDKFNSTLVSVPAGCFKTEGSNVCLDDFLISKYEVTQSLYKSVMGENPAFFDRCGADCPVEQVSWNDAQLFISRLNSKTGKHYRLPTEAEWEYACRSGGKNETYCGSDNIDDVAWHKGNSGDTTHHVGQKNPNSLGIFDMTGNAMEWVNDWYGNSYPSSANNPQGPPTGSKRVLRGGAAISEPVNNRVTQRGALAPDTRSGLTGFRVVSPIKE